MAMGCWAIANLRRFVNKKTLRLVYHSLVYPHIHYGISSWGSSAKYLLNKLEVKQKWALKIMTSSNLRSPSTPLFYNLKILKLEDVHKLKISTQICKMINNNTLNQYDIQFVQESHNYSTRTSARNNLAIPSVNKNIGKTTLRYKGPLIWNQVPSECREKSVNNFKFCFKRELINGYKVT